MSGSRVLLSLVIINFYEQIYKQLELFSGGGKVRETKWMEEPQVIHM